MTEFVQGKFRDAYAIEPSVSKRVGEIWRCLGEETVFASRSDPALSRR
jgi:hypothetical protein